MPDKIRCLNTTFCSLSVCCETTSLGCCYSHKTVNLRLYPLYTSLITMFMNYLCVLCFILLLTRLYKKLLCCVVQVWDLRQNKLIYNMHGHGDSVTGLSLSSEGSYLLSNSMDNTGTQPLCVYLQYMKIISS